MLETQSHVSLSLATQHGHVDVVQLLLDDKRVKPEASDCDALRKACKYGNVDVVRMLLKDGRSDPTVRENICIATAAYYNHGLVSSLYCDSVVFLCFCFFLPFILICLVWSTLEYTLEHTCQSANMH